MQDTGTAGFRSCRIQELQDTGYQSRRGCGRCSVLDTKAIIEERAADYSITGPECRQELQVSEFQGPEWRRELQDTG